MENTNGCEFDGDGVGGKVLNVGGAVDSRPLAWPSCTDSEAAVLRDHSRALAWPSGTDSGAVVVPVLRDNRIIS